MGSIPTAGTSHGPVAHVWLEQRTHNALVVCSTHTRPTNFNNKKRYKMPCMKCKNNKYKYGERGRCQFDTLESCKAAERAIYARENQKTKELNENKDSLEKDCSSEYND